MKLQQQIGTCITTLLVLTSRTARKNRLWLSTSSFLPSDSALTQNTTPYTLVCACDLSSLMFHGVLRRVIGNFGHDAAYTAWEERLESGAV